MENKCPNLVPELRAVIESQKEQIEHLTKRRRHWQEVNETTTDDLRKEFAENTALHAQLAPLQAVAEAAGEAVRLCGLEGSLDRLDAALADLPGGEG